MNFVKVSFVTLLFQLTGSSLLILRNVPDVLARALSADTHAKRVFTVLIIPAIPLFICPPRLLTIPCPVALARLVRAAQLLPYAVTYIGTLLGLLLKLTDA